MTNPCDRADCPVVAPTSRHLGKIKATTLPAGTKLFRGVRAPHSPTAMVPGVGNSRFAPLVNTEHVYVSRTATAALLESALHHLSGPQPTIWRVELANWSLGETTLAADVRLADLRDPALTRVGIERPSLVDTMPVHYPCTRQWATMLQDHTIDGGPIDGILWNSRQADIHARANQYGLLGDLLTHRQIEVAVLWSPNGPARPFKPRGAKTRPLVTETGVDQLMLELSALLGVPIE